MPEKRKNGVLTGIIITISLVSMLVAAVVMILAVRGLTGNHNAQDAGVPTTQFDYDGSTPVEPPRPMPDFTLTDQTGDAFHLTDLRGKPALLFFGFTRCPDVCPTTMSEFKAIQRELGDKGSQMNFVFISVDGSRDTPKVMADFFRVRGIDDFIGLTGAPDDVRRIGADYGVQIEFDEKDANGSYNIVHTPSLFLLDKEGNWIMKFDSGTEISVMVDYLKNII